MKERTVNSGDSCEHHYFLDMAFVLRREARLAFILTEVDPALVLFEKEPFFVHMDVVQHGIEQESSVAVVYEADSKLCRGGARQIIMGGTKIYIATIDIL